MGYKAESDSVTNQRKLLNNYVEEHEELMSSTFYIDEDFTGTNFKRPAFLRMIKAIEKQEINYVSVKDLARFGRDYRSRKIFRTSLSLTQLQIYFYY